jgi:hypothetical protein
MGLSLLILVRRAIANCGKLEKLLEHESLRGERRGGEDAEANASA